LNLRNRAAKKLSDLEVGEGSPGMSEDYFIDGKQIKRKQPKVKISKKERRRRRK